MDTVLEPVENLKVSRNSVGPASALALALGHNGADLRP